MTLYPIPEVIPVAFTHRGICAAILRRVTLDDRRFICHEVEEIACRLSFRQEFGRHEAYMAYRNLTDWIQDHMGDCYSYESWLSRVYDVPCEETDGDEAYPSQPPKLKASRLAWVAQMIAYLETQ